MPFLHGAGALTALALAACSALPSPALAQDATPEVRAGGLIVERPWVRATPPGARTAGGYATIVNTGTQPDALVGGSFEPASGFEVHTMSTDGGIMRMRPSGPVAIPPGGILTLAPSGRHIMFTGLRRGVREGESVEGTLVFEHAGTVAVRFAVEGIAARAPGGAVPPAPSMPAMPGMDMD